MNENGRRAFSVPTAIVVVVMTAAMSLVGWNLGQTEEVARRIETVSARQLDVIEHNTEQDRRIDRIDGELRDIYRILYAHTAPDRRPDPPP